MSKWEVRIPVLAPILRNRLLTIVITGAAILQLGLTILKVPGWQCPVLHVLGIPCPGCGLSRAIVLLCRGNWQKALAFHLFAPVFVLGIILVAVTSVLPTNPRNFLIALMERIELRTGITSIVLFGLIFYWLARLIILQSTFVDLIKS